MVLGERGVFMDFKPCVEAHNLVLVNLKSTKLYQMTNLDVIFFAVVSVYRLVKS